MAGGPTEQKKEYHVSKAFKAMNTKANRTAIDDEEFSWLLNAMPIGPGNIHIVPNSLQSEANAAPVALLANVSTMQSIEIQGNTYMATFQDNGASQFYDVDNHNTVLVAANATFSNANVSVTQFNKSYAVIGDPTKGLFVWDSNVTVQMGCGGAIGMLNVGSGYANTPAVVVSAPDQAGGIQAAGQAVLTGNVVSSVFWTQPGTGYTKPPVITLVGGGGNNANAIASLLNFRTGQIYYQILNGGQGFTNANVTVTGGGGDGTANATAIISNGTIINLIPQNLGNNYTNQANLVITVNGDGANASIKAFVESNTVTDVQTYAGRVWVSQGRQLLYSGATNFNDFTGISAGNFYVNDITLHGNILGMVVANNFLYFFGDDSINVISDVLVNSNGNTNLTNTNVGASIGTRRPNSIFPYYRYIMFQNDYGIYGLIGSTTVKLSDALDGIYNLIDFTKPVTSGQVIINNILCACFNFYINSPPLGSSGYYQAVFFDKKWFLTSQGNINYIAGSPTSGVLGMYGASGKTLYQLYVDKANLISSTVQTALWGLGDPIRDKQATKFGVEVTFNAAAGEIDLTMDNAQNSTSPYVLTTTVGWINNSGNAVTWTNGSNVVIGWTGGVGGYQLYRSDAQQPIAQSSGQKYIGMTLTSNTPNFVLNTLELEYEKRARF